MPSYFASARRIAAVWAIWLAAAQHVEFAPLVTRLLH